MGSLSPKTFNPQTSAFALLNRVVESQGVCVEARAMERTSCALEGNSY